MIFFEKKGTDRVEGRDRSFDVQLDLLDDRRNRGRGQS